MNESACSVVCGVCVCVRACTGMCAQSVVQRSQQLAPGPEPLDTDAWGSCLNAPNVSGVTASGCPVHSYQPSSNGSKTGEMKPGRW